MRTGGWSLVGRDEDVERLAALLRDPHGPAGLLLTGEAGIGKSRLALAVARRTEADVVELRANAALHPIPLGALAPLLATLGIDAQDGATAVLTGLHSALAQRPAVTVLVDDVPALDPASVAAVEQLVVARAARVVLTARDGQRLPAQIARLADDGALDVHPVGPLAPEASRLLLEAALGGPIDPSAARALHTESAGNPLFLRELLAGARDAGALRPGPHGWTLADVVPSRRLVEHVAQHFDGLGTEARALLELVAAGQPLPLHPAGRASSPAQELLDQGLIVLDPAAGGTQARLAHPVYDEVLRSITTAERWRAAQRAAAGVLLDGGGEDHHLRAATLLEAAGADLDPGQATRAAQRAFALLDHPLALRLADAALRADPGRFRAALVRAGSLSAIEDPRALVALRTAAGLASGDEEVALATQRLALHLALRAGRVPEAIAISEAALERIGDPGWRQFVAADLTKWRMMAGQQVQDLETTAEATGPARLNACLIAALLSAMDGRAATCEAAVREGLPLAAEHGDLLPNAADLLLLSRFLGLTCLGELDAARRHAEEQLARVADRQDEPVGMWSYALAVLDLHVGRASAAERRAADAIAALEWRDFTGLRPVARALRATALAHLGRATEAREVLATVDPAGLGDQKVALQHAQAQAWLLVHDGDAAAAAGLLAERGRAGIAADHVLLGALASYEAVRLGHATLVVDDLERAAERADRGVVHVLAAHARALAAGDPIALERAAETLARTGLATAAADALVQASRLQARAGRSEAARRATLRAAELRADLDGVAGAATAAPVLTPREREIAVRAARRERSREIAADLGVSTRTVDNHLARVYRKLGLTGRGELAEALLALGI